MKELTQSHKDYIKKLEHYEKLSEHNNSYKRASFLMDKRIETLYDTTNNLRIIINIAVKYFKMSKILFNIYFILLKYFKM